MAIGKGVQYAGQFKLAECKLISSTGVVARLDTSVIEINIFENIFSQSLIVKLSILDTNNMVMNMPIVGQEYVKLKIVTPGVGEFDFTDNVFVVHRVSLRTDSSNSSQIYELSLVTPESLRNARTRVSKSYDDTVSNIVTSILRDERYINTNKEIHVDNTDVVRKFVAPNLRPNTFISHLTREATSAKYGGSPQYLFFENTRGFNFRVLDSLYSQPFKGEFVASEPALIEGENKTSNLEQDYRRIVNLSINNTNDTLISSMGGMLSSKLTTYNMYFKNFEETTFNYFDNFKDYGRIDQNPIYNNIVIDKFNNSIGDFSNARVHLHPSTQTDGLDNIGDNLYSDNQSEKWILHRRSKTLEMQGGLTMEIKIHGYCNIAVGDKVKLTLPVTGKDHGKSKVDTFYRDEFLITTLRHTFDLQERKHFTLMSVFKDSMPAEFKNVGSSKEPRGRRELIVNY